MSEVPEHVRQALAQIFGEHEAAPNETEGADEMIPACLGVLVHRAGGEVVITQADLDAVNNRRMVVNVDPAAEQIAIKFVEVK